jgi:hypothetical protein
MERDLEERDTDFPIFEQSIRETIHHTADSPDYAIYTADVNGAYRYRIRGVVGAADSFNLTAQQRYRTGPDGKPLPSDEPRVVGTLDDSHLEIDADGAFQIIVSADPPSEGVWLRMGPGVNTIYVRNISTRPFGPIVGIARPSWKSSALMARGHHRRIPPPSCSGRWRKFRRQSAERWVGTGSPSVTTYAAMVSSTPSRLCGPTPTRALPSKTRNGH